MNKTEELITKILTTLSAKFRKNLILKGGILMRLYQSPRYTKDIDFVLITRESRKKWAPLLVQALEGIDGVKVGKVQLHSRGIWLDVIAEAEKTGCLVEVSFLPFTQLPPETLSTAYLARQYNVAACLVSAMALPEAYANKIAAALERAVGRDFYDLSQMEEMGTFDINTLKTRLSKLSVERARPKAVTFPEAAQLLRKRLQALSQESIEKELNPLLPPEYQPGVLRVIQASVGRLIQRLEQLC
ncbi:MAG: nucleotidyl transferase AbiEii/AbiGii toxin family protein [Deltaproteobacteria bacterium]|nr:nucleotidyl transferase AbiEii/AbiGii toxin family protein [Deltaproteobacteria bacterium]MBI4224415.1 nucleotidyl transferase AbiEii/AbiGii toxin family protein [Deltaproteobacteria bacterium]